MVLYPFVSGKYISLYLFNEPLKQERKKKNVQSTDFEVSETCCENFAQPCVIVTLT